MGFMNAALAFRAVFFFAVLAIKSPCLVVVGPHPHDLCLRRLRRLGDTSATICLVRQPVDLRLSTIDFDYRLSTSTIDCRLSTLTVDLRLWTCDCRLAARPPAHSVA